jgi:hypothetical protein
MQNLCQNISLWSANNGKGIYIVTMVSSGPNIVTVSKMSTEQNELDA